VGELVSVHVIPRRTKKRRNSTRRRSIKNRSLMLHDKDLVPFRRRGQRWKGLRGFQKFRAFTQEQVDAIVERMAAAGRAQARRLAELAVEETGYGNAKDKLAKNLLCADLLRAACVPQDRRHHSRVAR